MFTYDEYLTDKGFKYVKNISVLGSQPCEDLEKHHSIQIQFFITGLIFRGRPNEKKYYKKVWI